MLVVSRSRTRILSFPDLMLNGTVVKITTELKVQGVILNSKFSVENNLRSIAVSASNQLGIMRQALCLTITH